MTYPFLLFTVPSLQGEPQWHCCTTVAATQFSSHQHQASQASRYTNHTPVRSAHSFIHSFNPSSCSARLLLCATVPRHALHQYCYLSAAWLSRPLSPSHFHSYYALFCFHAGSVGGWSHRWRDDFMLQQQQKWEEQTTTSLRAYLSLN